MSTATEMLAKYLAAEAAILEGKEVRLNGRVLRREDLDLVREGRKEWEAKVAAEEAAAKGTPTVGGLGFSLARLDGR